MTEVNSITTPIARTVRQTPSLGSVALGGLIAGAVTGATIAAAKSARKVQEGKINAKQAIGAVARESGTMGLATTLGVSTTALLGLNGVLSIAGVALFTAASKYGIDSLLPKEKCCKTKKAQSCQTPALEPELLEA